MVSPRAGLRVASAQWPPPGASGDFFEMSRHGDGATSVFFGDVSGNGAGAARLANRAGQLVSQRMRDLPPPGRLLEQVNEALERELSPDSFVVAVAAHIDARRRTMKVASAGHLGPFVKRACGSPVSPAQASGPPLGMFPGQGYAETAFRLGPSDVVVFATDGISDRFATTRDPGGESGLLARLGRLASDPACLCRRLLQAASPLATDAAVLAVQLVG
jgi:sigma-B regulation protein RsbU (phosphoserine phosphatase)